jgi:PAS domain S-box-containing protein
VFDTVVHRCRAWGPSLSDSSFSPTEPQAFLDGGGQLGGLIADFDWSQTSLGPIVDWPVSLRSAVSILVRSPVPMVMLWGVDGVMIYNDAYSIFAGGRHPELLGQKVLSGGWPEVAEFNANVLKVGLAGGTLAYRDQELTLHRSGRPEQVFMDLDYSPVPDDEGRPAGVIAIVIETTERVAAERRRAAAEEATRVEAERVLLALNAGAIIGTWVWDVPCDRFTADERFAASFDLDSELCRTGLPIEQVTASIHPEDQARVNATIAEALARGGRYRCEYRVRHRDHGFVWIEANGHVEVGADGKALRFPGVLLDISLRKSAEDARLASEARLRLVIEGAKDHAILTTDPEGVVTSWSAGAEAIFGWASDEIIGRPGAVIFTPEDRAAGVDVLELETAAAIGFANDERWHLRKDGRRVFMNGSVHPLPADEDGRPLGFLKIARDETERRRTDEDLRRLNADLERQVIERSTERGTTWQISPFMLSVVDLADGRFIRVNPAWTKVLGYAAEEIIGRRYLEFLHPDDVERTMSGYAEVERGHPILDFENRYRAKGGDYRWLKWVAVPEDGKLYSTVRDVTAEKAAVAERDQLWTLADDMLARADYTGMMSAVNPAWTRVLGFSENELLTRPYSDFMHSEDVAVTLAALRAMSETQQATRFENRILTSSGDWKPIGWTVVPEADGLNFIAVGRDLTEDKARERQLLDTQEALRQSQKMEAVGQLTGGIAHDFNNLLAGITGSLELVQKRIAEQGLTGFDRHLGIAQGSAQRAASLTQRLLAFSRRQTLDPKPLDVNRLIQGVEDLVRRSVGPSIEVEIVGAVGLWVTRIDGSQLENALLNLAINARDAMPDGGRITIETANKWLDAHAAKERDLPPGQYISVCVTDTGTGMTPEVIQRAFDPFYTTKPLGHGTGLGLSMIHGFVRQSGGQVRIYSEVGQGTTVCLYMPRFAGEAESDQAGDAEAALEQGQGETVLVIDDEEPIRMLIGDVLGEAGYRVLEAADGPAGLKILQSDVRVDLLITDVGLPGGFNGRQVADAARQTRPELKILFITGYAENAVVGNGHLDVGMQVITKPFAMTALALRVREIIEG